MDEEKYAARMSEIFDGYREAHGTHGEPRQKPDSTKWEIKSTARTLREPVTVELWREHLAGRRPLGIVPIRGDGKCRWGSVDYDVYDDDLSAVVERARRAKLPLVPCRSKSGGLHLFLFMAEWTSAASVQSALRDMAAQIGLAGSEIFPKQVAMLVERGDMGSWMVMPYFGGTFGGKLRTQVGLKSGGAEMTLAEFVAAAREHAQREVDLARFTRKRAAAGAGKPRADSAPSGDGPFSDGPPCLQTMAGTGVGRGYQSDSLLMMGIYYKRKNPEGWRQDVEEAARTYLDPPGTSEGTASVIRSLGKKDYRYTCKKEPMCSHCNAPLCRTRQFGIGDDGEYPTLSGLQILPSDPPLYFLDINGQRVELTEDQLFHYAQFQKVCMRLGKLFAPMKQSDWLEALRPFVDNMQEVEIPEELRVAGVFHELLEEFCTNRQAGVVPQDLLSGRPYYDDDERRHYFRLRDLMAFAHQNGMRDLPRGKAAQMIRELGGDGKVLNIKGKPQRAWYVPGDQIHGPPEVDAPTRREAEI